MARTVKKEKALKPEEKLSQALVLDMEQPYRVPENWCWTTVNCVSDVVTGGTPSKKHPEYYGDTFPFFKPSDLDAGRNVFDASEYLTEAGKSISRIIPANSSAVCCIGSIGKCGFLMREGTTNQQINSAIPKITPLYLYYYFLTESFVNELWSKASATTISIVNKTKMEQCLFPLAPLAEQQRIVDRIESLFAKLDEAKEKARAVVEGFEDRKAAILHKAFSGELTEEWRKNNGIAKDTWKNQPIGDLFYHTTGKALKKSNTTGILRKYITTSNLYWGYFDFSEVREMYYTEDELEKCTARKGDLLLCNGGDVGRAAIWNYNYDICLQNHISKLRKKEENVDIDFFYYYFMLSKIKGIVNGKGIGIASLSAKDLMAMRVNLPPLKEQHEIANRLEDLLTREQQAKETAEQVLDQIDSMKKSILARAFRGGLGTSNPTDEPATDLLRKILEQSN